MAGWSGSLSCRATWRPPDRAIQGPLFIERTASWRLAERVPSIVLAGMLARALGTTLAEVFGELEPEVIPP